jgi:hypothetical protein
VIYPVKRITGENVANADIRKKRGVEYEKLEEALVICVEQ